MRTNERTMPLIRHTTARRQMHGTSTVKLSSVNSIAVGGIHYFLISLFLLIEASSGQV